MGTDSAAPAAPGHWASTVAREGPRVPVWGRRPCTMIRARSRVLREPNQAGGPGSREEGQPRRRDCCTIATRRGVVGRAVYQGYKEKNSRDGGGYSTSSTNFHKVGFNAASLSGPHAEKRVASAGGRPRPLLAMGRLREKMVRGIQWWAGRSEAERWLQASGSFGEPEEAITRTIEGAVAGTALRVVARATPAPRNAMQCIIT